MAKSGPGSDLRRSVGEATAKIEAIVDAAEDTAEQIRSEADAEAQAYVKTRKAEVDQEVEERHRQARAEIDESADRVGELTEPLLRRVEALKGEADSLSHDLTRVIDSLRDLSRKPDDSEPAATRPQTPVAAPTGSPPARPVIAPAPAPTSYGGTDTEATGAADDGPSEAALLRVTQMAVAGSERGEIADTLRSEFGMKDVDSVLDDILGKAS